LYGSAHTFPAIVSTISMRGKMKSQTATTSHPSPRKKINKERF
jgi:hypothetical protein